MEVEGRMPVGGPLVDRVIGITDTRAEIATPVLARLLAHGAELMGEVVDYEDVYRLCYIRGPEGMIVGLAQGLG